MIEIILIIALYGLGANATDNVTMWDCPTGPSYDLLDRSWCDSHGVIEP
jgi:hypothetical protein